jgi:hypothetical protein
MKNQITTLNVSEEHYVVQIDGRAKSGHRRFLDALRAALVLRDQFPQQDVKVRANAELQRPVLH